MTKHLAQQPRRLHSEQAALVHQTRTQKQQAHQSQQPAGTATNSSRVSQPTPGKQWSPANQRLRASC